MTFGEKLDFLMSITKTSNSALANSVMLDASYISRLRGGKRQRPKDHRMIQSMAAFLVRRIKEDYQKKALFDAVKPARLPDDLHLLSDEIAHWLVRNGEDRAEQVGRFLNHLSGMTGPAAAASSPEGWRHPFPDKPLTIYYGVEGKRQAAEHFLSEIAAQETPQTLLLFSDEGTAWMTENPAYARKWAALMARVLARGNRIRIIHTVSRDLDEMLSAISQWMPLYMNGQIEPYFYPKKRDGVFKRTLFIAPETAAVVSNSIGGQISVAANILHRDPTAVASYAEEFLQYLRLCRPLMRIFTAKDRDACYDTLTEFEGERADTLIMTESLSSLTMPEALMASIIGRAGVDPARHLSVHALRRAYFLENLQSGRFTEVLHLPDIETVRNGGVKVSMSDMLEGGAVFYEAKAYAAHLEQVVALLGSCENYRVVFTDRQKEDRYTVYAREELGVIVAKTSQPPVVLAMSEGNMIAAFWGFLKDLAGENAWTAADQAAAIGRIENYLQKLRAEI